MDNEIQPIPVHTGPAAAYPLQLGRVQAGFPSPSDDYLEQALDLNEYLVPNPPATFFVRACGESMIQAGIHDGDLLIVDRSLRPHNGCVAIVAINGELAVKFLLMRGQKLYLRSANRAFRDIAVGDDEDVHVWGVCRHVIHTLG